MTKTEKLQIYNLLKTASDSFYGFSSPNFPDEAPDFEDDIIPEQASDLKGSKIDGKTENRVSSQNGNQTTNLDSNPNTKTNIGQTEKNIEASENNFGSEDSNISENERLSANSDSLSSVPSDSTIYDSLKSDSATSSESNSAEKTSSSLSSIEQNVKSTIENINSKVLACKRCALCAGRRQAVPGMGAENPLVLVIGEGPGEEEDKQGLPFVGPAGQLLDKMLAAIHLYRNKNCYIANIVKCRPPMNRVPYLEEADACRPFLDAQIAALKPKAILCAGSTAVKNLLHTNSGVMKLHGKVLDYNGIPLVTTWHPSALLRAPENKRPAWEDLKIFRNELLKINPGYESD